MPQRKALTAVVSCCAAMLLTMGALPSHGATSAPEDTAALRLSGQLLTVPKARLSDEQARVTPLVTLLDAANAYAAAVRSADADTRIAKAQEKQAWGKAWMPSLEFDANKFRTRESVNENLDVRMPTSDVKLTARLPVWQASDRAIADAHNAKTLQADWQARLQRTNVAHDLCLAYVNATEAAEQRRLAEAQLALLQSQLDINEKRLKGGMGTVLDQLETRTRVDQIRASSQDQRMRAATQRLTIERLSGQPTTLPAGFHPLATTLPDDLPSLNDALEQATHVNPQIQSAQADILSAKAVASARNAELWQPTLDAQASSERQRQSQLYLGRNDPYNTNIHSSVGVMLNWPLFSGGQTHGRVQEAAASLSKAEAGHDDALTTVQGGLRDAYQSLEQARAMLAAQRDVEQTAVATFEAVRKAFVAGLRTNIDLLNAQQQIYVARQNQLDARVKGLSAYVNILTLLDQLDETHVAPLATQFDAVAMDN